VDIQLQWFNQHGIEIVDVAAPGRFFAISFIVMSFNMYL